MAVIFDDESAEPKKSTVIFEDDAPEESGGRPNDVGPQSIERKGIKPVKKLRGVNDMPYEGTHFDPTLKGDSPGNIAKGVAENVGGILETPMSMLSGAASTLASIPAGLYKGATEGYDSAMNMMRKVQHGGTYEPRTEMGKMATNIVGAPFTLAGEGGAAVTKAAGGGEAAQQLAREVTPAALSAATGVRGAVRPAVKGIPQHVEAMAEAQKSGYSMPPKDMNPSLLNKATSIVARPSGVEASLAAKNVKVSEALAKKELGLKPTDRLDDKAIKNVRTEAGKSYESISNSGKVFDTNDPVFVQELADVDKSLHTAKSEFPEAFKDNELENIRAQVSDARASGDSIIKLVQKYRRDATTLLKKEDNTLGEIAAAEARKSVATVLENMMERELSKDPATAGLVGQMRKDRERIAKSHDIEAATNLETGDIDPVKLARLANNGVKLSGNLAKIVQAYKANKKVMSSRENLPSDALHAGDSTVGHAVLGGLGAAAGAIAGHPTEGAMLGVALPSAVRGAATSGLYQRAFAKPKPTMQIAPSTVDPRAAALGAIATALPPAMRPQMKTEPQQ
jgi:hypothetical protein